MICSQKQIELHFPEKRRIIRPPGQDSTGAAPMYVVAGRSPQDLHIQVTCRLEALQYVIASNIALEWLDCCLACRSSYSAGLQDVLQA